METVIATRGSALPLKQTQEVMELLSARFSCSYVPIAVVKTRGDRLVVAPLTAMR
jgi:porphobilinogen deaminase